MPLSALPTLHLHTLERLAIQLALEETRGNRVRAARVLGIHVRTLHRKLREIEGQDGVTHESPRARELVAV
jgi:DNA-binding NtrC family response regulator